MKCKICGGYLICLGKLGKFTYYRCHNCGLEYRK